MVLASCGTGPVVPAGVCMSTLPRCGCRESNSACPEPCQCPTAASPGGMGSTGLSLSVWCQDPGACNPLPSWGAPSATGTRASAAALIHIHGSLLPNPDCLPGSTYYCPLTSVGLPDIKSDRSLSALYLFPQQLTPHRSILLPGVRRPAPILTENDREGARRHHLGGGGRRGGGPGPATGHWSQSYQNGRDYGRSDGARGGGPPHGGQSRGGGYGGNSYGNDGYGGYGNNSYGGANNYNHSSHSAPPSVKRSGLSFGTSQDRSWILRQ